MSKLVDYEISTEGGEWGKSPESARDSWFVLFLAVFFGIFMLFMVYNVHF